MSDMAFRQAHADETNRSAALIRGEASQETIRAELASERAEREFLETKLQRQFTLIQNLKCEAEEVPLLKRKIHELEECCSANKEKLEDAKAQLAARFEELAQMTSALLSEEDEHDKQKREAERFLKMLRVFLLELYGAPVLVFRRRLATRLIQRLAREGLFDPKSYSKEFPDVIAAGHEPLHHYILHGVDEIRSGFR